MKSILEKVKTEFSSALKRQLTPPDGQWKVCCALSGGPDSTVLLLLLKEFSSEFSYTLEAAYVDHGIRDAAEMEREKAHVSSLCESLEVPLHKKSLDSGFLEHYARQKGCGIESAARAYRYHFFEKISGNSPVPVFFALGHNRNDQVETLLMRLFSGSGPEGVRGIPETRANYFRPLIDTDRSDIEAWLGGLKVETVSDSTNDEIEYLRNRVRHKILPAVRDSFPACEDSILGFQNDLKDLMDHYSSLLGSACSWAGSAGEGFFSCRESDFSELPFVSRKSLLLEKINRLQKGQNPGRRIPSSFFTPLKDLRGRILLKGHGILFKKEKGRLILSLNRPDEADCRFFLVSAGRDYRREGLRLCVLKGCDIVSEATVLAELNDPADSFVIRTPFGAGEVRSSGVLHKGEERVIEALVFRGNNLLCALGTGGFILPEKAAGKKIENIISECYYLCIIIKGRGHYAPGRQKRQ
ncbi:MAG: tRNA lysidine(34) synthetase TilS [Spirochaetales bacterium]|nr:tRNA lysidine(34) synthetase TilS [Spirochaetales bacterium]